MYKLAFFVPEHEKETVKSAVFDAGAGKFNRDDHCSWETEGTGQLRPLEGSNPFIGSIGNVEYVKEFRVEMICKDELILKVIEALLENHPYEEPAYEVWRIDTFETL